MLAISPAQIYSSRAVSTRRVSFRRVEDTAWRQSQMHRIIPTDNLPLVMHYCQRYALGRWFFSKYKLREDFSTVMLHCCENHQKMSPNYTTGTFSQMVSKWRIITNWIVITILSRMDGCCALSCFHSMGGDDSNQNQTLCWSRCEFPKDSSLSWRANVWTIRGWSFESISD